MLRLPVFLFFVSGAMVLNAQTLNQTITGKVTDEFGRPLWGALISSAQGKNGTSTNVDGVYSITVDDGSKSLLFSNKHYKSQTISFAGGEVLNVQLAWDAMAGDDIVDLGYSSQKVGQVTGAVSSVDGGVLARSPVANFTMTLPGRLSGLYTQQGYSELTRTTTSLYSRGISSGRGIAPLVIIDGIMNSFNSGQSLEYITPEEVESVVLLKDASTQALYGIQGANGVLVIRTKRGVKMDGLKISGRFDQTMHQATTRPAFYDAASWAEMRNQAAINDGEAPNYFFSQEKINHYRSGDMPDKYQNNNWYNRYIRDITGMQRGSLQIQGGNDRVVFYSNLNVLHQGGPFYTDQTKYKSNSNYTWLNYRGNVDVKINDWLGAFVRLGGNIKRERQPGGLVNAQDAYSTVFLMPSFTYGPLTPEVKDPNTGNITDPGGKVITTDRVGSPTYGILNRSGYSRHTVTNISSHFGLKMDMDYLTKGLDFVGTFAYQTNSVGSLTTTQNYERWLRSDNTDELIFTKKGTNNNTPLSYGKGAGYYYTLSYNTALNYNRQFGAHRIGGMAYMFYQNLITGNFSGAEILPHNRVSSGVEVDYGFDDRYLLKADLGYSGSEQYARDKRFVFTPAISAGWVASNEPFLKGNDVLTFFKLRGSFGVTGNDQGNLNRYAYLDNIRYQGGGPIPYLQYLIVERQRGNPDIAAELVTKVNAGADLTFLNAVSMTLDVFSDKMDNLIVDPTGNIPLYQGIPLGSYPPTNSGKFKNQGYEITVRYEKNINPDWKISIGAMVSQAKNTNIDVKEAKRTDDFAYKNRIEGYPVGQLFGYLVDYSDGNGYYNTQQELTNSALTYSMGVPRLGDLKFRDLNGDKIIDQRDLAPLGYGALPQYAYSADGGVSYKGFELNLLFQGVSKFTGMYGGPFGAEYDGIYTSLAANAWTPERQANGEKITWPALSLKSITSSQPSDFMLMDLSYLRLRNAELSYVLPYSITRNIGLNKVKLILSGQNLLTWDKLKFNDFGPEGSGYYGFPVYRAYNAGISVIF